MSQVGRRISRLLLALKEDQSGEDLWTSEAERTTCRVCLRMWRDTEIDLSLQDETLCILQTMDDVDLQW